MEGGEKAILWVIIAAMVVLVGYAAVQLRKRKRRRRAELQQWAERHDGTFTAEDLALTERWKLPPILGVGAATDIVRATLDEGEFIGFTHTNAPTGGSPTSRVVGVLDIGTDLPTLVATSPAYTILEPHPPYPVDLGDSGLGWNAFAADAATASAALRLLTPEVRDRLAEDASVARLELVLEGQEILVATYGYLDGASLERWVAVLRDLARMMPTG